MYLCVSGHVFVLAVMYLCVSSHVFVIAVMHLCVSGHVFVCQRSCICVLAVMYLCVCGHVFVCQLSCICVLAVMYLCVSGNAFVCQLSCICVLALMYLCASCHVFVLGVSFRLFQRFLGVSLPSLCQARKVSGHVFVCQRYRYHACTKPGKCEVMYLCAMGIVKKPVPSQESVRSCICVLGVSLPSLYQARKVSGHVFVCQGYRDQACTKPGK